MYVFMYSAGSLCIVALSQATQVFLTHLRCSLLLIVIDSLSQNRAVLVNQLTMLSQTGKASPKFFHQRQAHTDNSQRVELFSSILQHLVYTFKSKLLITVRSGTAVRSHSVTVQFIRPILYGFFRTR